MITSVEFFTFIAVLVTLIDFKITAGIRTILDLVDFFLVSASSCLIEFKLCVNVSYKQTAVCMNVKESKQHLHDQHSDQLRERERSCCHLHGWRHIALDIIHTRAHTQVLLSSTRMASHCSSSNTHTRAHTGLVVIYTDGVTLL